MYSNVKDQVLHIIGMSPGNSYFKDEEISHLLRTLIERFGRVVVLVADIPAISTYVALGYPQNRARRDKALPKGNALRNRVRKIMAQLSYSEEQVLIIDWEHDVEQNLNYQKQYKIISQLYETNKSFHQMAAETTRVVLESSKREVENLDTATEIAVHYLLSELAYLEFAHEFFHVHKVVYVYHKNWRVYEDYISGKFDGVVKKHLDFLLMENPYETYSVLWGFEDGEMNGGAQDALGRIESTKTIRVGFMNYPPTFLYDQKQNHFSGIFYEVIERIAERHGWILRLSEEVGYGVILEGLTQERFDIFGSTVWPTPERLSSAIFTGALYQSSVYVWTRRDDKRTILELQEDDSARVVVKEGDVSDSIACADFANNRRVYVPQLADPTELLAFVVDGRADFTFVEPYLADHFQKTTRGLLERISTEPIRVYENTFMLKKGDERLRELFDQEIDRMKNKGEIEELIEKYTGSKTTFGLL